MLEKVKLLSSLYRQITYRCLFLGSELDEVLNISPQELCINSIARFSLSVLRYTYKEKSLKIIALLML